MSEPEQKRLKVGAGAETKSFGSTTLVQIHKKLLESDFEKMVKITAT
jgi:hypothetical protein